MKQFVIIFRQGPRQLTEADLKDRAEETRAWAQRQNAAGFAQAVDVARAHPALRYGAGVEVRPWAPPPAPPPTAQP